MYFIKKHWMKIYRTYLNKNFCIIMVFQYLAYFRQKRIFLNQNEKYTFYRKMSWWKFVYLIHAKNSASQCFLHICRIFCSKNQISEFQGFFFKSKQKILILLNNVWKRIRRTYLSKQFYCDVFSYLVQFDWIMDFYY